MPLGKIESPYFKDSSERIQQGDLIRDLVISELSGFSDNEISISDRNIPYCVVMSQDCDLEHDFNQLSNPASTNHDKLLPSILLCPAYVSEIFREGKHLEGEGKFMQRINSNDWGKLASNQTYRYHYLTPWTELQVPALVVDFKHYFTVSRLKMYREESKKLHIATIEILYREHLSSRFAHYLSRVGLPELTAP